MNIYEGKKLYAKWKTPPLPIMYGWVYVAIGPELDAIVPADCEYKWDALELKIDELVDHHCEAVHGVKWGAYVRLTFRDGDRGKQYHKKWFFRLVQKMEGNSSYVGWEEYTPRFCKDPEYETQYRDIFDMRFIVFSCNANVVPPFVLQ
jgi:hypothetical protein